MLKLALLSVPPGSAVLIAQSAESPVQFFTQLGIASAVCIVIYLWLRDTMKQRDRLMDAMEQIRPVLIEVQHALHRSNEAHQAGSEAAKALINTLRDFPDPKVWFNLDAVVGKMERVVGKLEAVDRKPLGE
jgi:hypothetical protein